MAKGKKAAESPKEAKQIVLNVDTFRRARDSVVTHLGTLQDSIQTLSSGIQMLSNNYIRHTNVILLDNASETEINFSLSKLTDITSLLGDHQRVPSPVQSVAPVEPVSDKKERKKRQHDPNAPKRPLTPFFLYMQTARPIISHDLGPDVEKKTVATEGTRRWSTMEAADKQLWSNAYKENLRLYNARVHAYRNGNPRAKEMTDDEALFYAENHSIGNDNSADAQLVGEASATAPLDEDDAEGEPERQPSPPPKTPKGKATRKSKGAKETPASASDTIVPPSSIVPPKAAPAEKEKSPDRKRKRGGKKDAAEEVVEETSTPKSAPKSRKKKAKTDA